VVKRRQIYIVLFSVLSVLFLYKYSFAQYKPEISENAELKARWNEGSCYSVYVENRKAYVANGSYFDIINVKNPANPASIGSVSLPSAIYDVYVSGSYAYTATDDKGLKVIDITNSSSPTEVGSYDTGGNAEGVYVSGGYCYIADGDSGLCIIDISNPSSPVKKAHYYTGGFCYNVFVFGSYAYLATGDSGLKIIDVSNKSTPVKTGSFDTEGTARGVFVSGNYAYIADGYSGLRIIDVSDPTNPVEASSYNPGTDFRNVIISNNYAYIADAMESLRIIDVSDPANPVQAGYYTTGGTARDIYVSGNHAYLGVSTKGLYIFENELLHNGNSKLTMDIEKEFSADYDSSNYITNVDENTNFYLSLYIKDVYDLNSYTVTVSFDTSKVNFVSAKEKVIFLEENVLGSSEHQSTAGVKTDTLNEVEITVTRNDTLGYTHNSWAFLGYIKFKTKYGFTRKDTAHFIYKYCELNNIYNETSYTQVRDSVYTQNATVNGTETRVLPVELVSFDAISGKDYVKLTWTTASESNNFGFEIEKSKDQINFIKIGFVPGSGTTEKEMHYSYMDNNLSSGIYFYRLKQIDYDGKFTYSKIINTEINKPEAIYLYQNYPNPFNSNTKIIFDLKENCFAEIYVYNVVGQMVRKLISGDMKSGHYELNFNSEGLSSGVYFYTLKTKNYVLTRKLSIIK